MLTGPVARRQIEFRGALQAAGAAGEVFKVAALGELGRDLVGRVTVGLVAVAVAHLARPNIEQRAVMEGPLIAHIGQPGDDIGLGGALLGYERGQALVGRVVVVEEQAGGEDVVRVHIGLGFGQVAAADDRVGVGARRQSGDVVVVVLQLYAVEPPRMVAHQRAGKCEAGHELVEVDATIDIAVRGNEIGGVEPELVVAHTGVEGDDASGGAAVLDRIACGFFIDGADRVRADADIEGALGGRADVEAVDGVEGLPGFGAIDVDLAGGVLHHAGIKGQQVANVA